VPDGPTDGCCPAERPVLIIEGTGSSRELLETLLRGWSIPPVSVGTAEEGLALLERRNRPGAIDPFGLVVLDWMLPGMNGLDAAARIRARDETRTLPIVLISAYAGKEEEARCAALGVNVFLPKPITASSLFDAVVEKRPASAVELWHRLGEVALSAPWSPERAELWWREHLPEFAGGSGSADSTGDIRLPQRQ
jgi:CheY-like chemotaxis protein